MAQNRHIKNTTKKSSNKKASTAFSGLEKLLLVGILLLTFIAFVPSLSNGFVNWDDDGYVTNNPIIQDFSIRNLLHIFNPSTIIMVNYHPMTILSYCIEFQLFKFNPAYYHFDNLLLHLLNVLVVYLLIKRLTLSNKIAAVTALLFGIHPMRVESVAWVAERKDVLYTFFFLVSMYCYSIWVTKKNLKYYIASIVLFILSILSKGQAVVLAPALFLIDYLLQRKLDKNLWVEKVPFFLLAVISGLISMADQGATLSGYTLVKLSLLDRFLVANYGLMMYIYKLFVPLGLNCYNAYPEHINGIFYFGPLINAALLIALFIFGRKNKEYAFGGLFFLITISIVLQFIPIGDAITAERYTYLSYLGLFFIIAFVYDKLEQQFNAIRIIGIGYLLVFMVLTFNQNKVWHDNKSLWEQVLDNNYENSIALNNLGQYYFDGQQPDQAFDYFSRAIKSDSNYFGAYYNRGNIYNNKGQYDFAISDFTKAIKCKKDFPEAYRNRSVVYNNIGKADLALNDLDSAIHLNPNYFDAYNDRSRIYLNKGKLDSAKADIAKCIQLNPNYSPPKIDSNPQITPKF